MTKSVNNKAMCKQTLLVKGHESLFCFYNIYFSKYFLESFMIMF